MDVFVELKAIISDFQAKMAEARGEMSKTAKEGSGHFAALGKASGLLVGAVAAGAAGAGVLAVKLGNQLEDSTARLEQAIKNTGGNFDTFKGQISNADTAMERFGFTNAQTQDALAAGTIATGSASKALSLLTLAADLARFKHIDLASAETIVAKASEGNTRGLLQLGIVLPGISSKSTTLAEANKKGAEILAVLNQRLGGQAAAAAGTFSGRMEVAKARVEDMAAKLGEKLIPIIEKLIAVTTSVIGWFDKHKAAALALAAVIGGVLATAFTVFTVNKIAQFIGGIRSAWSALGTLMGRSRETAVTVEADNAAMGGSAASFGGKLSGALGVAGAGIIAFQGTMSLLKSNFLGVGDAVNSVAGAIGRFFGLVKSQSQVDASTFKQMLTPADVSFLEQVASGAYVDAKISASTARTELHEMGIPGYAIGGYVSSGGLALLHSGETVVPANPARGFGGGDLILQIDRQQFATIAGPIVRQWLLQTAGHGNSRKIGLA